MKRTIAITILLMLGIAAPATAGGFSTVGLEGLPTSAAPGESRTVSVTYLGHGRTPITGARPVVLLRSGERTLRFLARPAARPGVYRAQVDLPAAGRWRVAVDEGWGNEHAFGALALHGDDAARGAPAASDRDPVLPLAVAALAGVLAAAATALVRRRRPRPLRGRRPSPVVP
jgi:hypothetical protein